LAEPRLVDLFDEVEEQLRSARYKSLALKIAPWAVIIAVLALGGALGWWWWQTRQDNAAFAASEQYAQALATLGGGDETRAYGQLAEIAQSGPPVYRAMALMHQGALRLEARKTDE